MILTQEQIDNLKDKNETSLDERPLSRQECRNLMRVIEAQQQELFELKYGKYCRDYYINEVWSYEIENKKQKEEIRQLQAQVARMREALEEAIRVVPGLRVFAGVYGKYKDALSNAPTEYHNPADVEAMKLARDTLVSVSFRSGLGSDEETIQKALAAIEKQIGGQE